MSQFDQSLMQLRAALGQRAERIKRGSYATSVLFGPLSDSQFSITVQWKNKDGSAGTHVAVYNKNAFSMVGTTRWKLKQSPCRFADDVIREVLMRRGVIR
jgi:hypothetical protein